MIKEIREFYNSNFSLSKYQAFLDDINSILKFPCDFRISETPLFLSKELQDKLLAACNDIIQQLQTKEFKQHSSKAVPDGLAAPNEDEHTIFLQIDFAVSKDEQNNFIPKLIELQGFPSLYGFQVYQAELFKKHFGITEDWKTYFNNYEKE